MLILLICFMPRPMPLGLRVKRALRVIRLEDFEIKEAVDEVPEMADLTLAIWITSEESSIKFICSEHDGDTKHTIDMNSTAMYPGLVIHYTNGSVVEAGGLGYLAGVHRHDVRYDCGCLLTEVERKTSALRDEENGTTS